MPFDYWCEEFLLILYSVIIACVAQMVYTARVAGDRDLTFDSWPATLCMEIVQCVSLTTACIPYLQPFLLSLESGLLCSDDYRRQSIKNSSYASGRPSKPASTSEQPLNSYASRSQSVQTNLKLSLQNPENGQSHPPTIPMLSMMGSGESLRTQLGITWDRRSGSSRTSVTETTEQAPAAVDTRRRELEGY